MCLAVSREFERLEEWLQLLTQTYAASPDAALAKTINYYLQRVIHHDDFSLDSNKQCDYICMLRYWQYQE